MVPGRFDRQEGKAKMTTGELVLLELKRHRMQKQDPERAAREMVYDAHERSTRRRDEWIKAGGTVVFRSVEAADGSVIVCDLIDRDCYRVAFAVSEQGSVDAEAHALQNLVNAQFEARQAKEGQGK